MEDYKKINLDYYDKNAVNLANRYSSYVDIDKRKEFNEFLNLLNGKKVLDLGCGGGEHSLWFKDKGLDVISLDFSPKMIELCRAKGLNGVVMDIENLEFSEKTFDGVWTATSLLHVPKSNIPNVVKKISSIIKDRGILFVCLKEGGDEGFIKDSSGNKRFFSFYRKNEIINFFDKDFELIDFWKSEERNIPFLHFFFRKL